MSLVQEKAPLVLVNDDVCGFILESSDTWTHPDFHIILTDLNKYVLQALKRFFLLLQKQEQTTRTRSTSVCLTLDFSKVARRDCVNVYKFLVKNIGPEVTELRFCGMENPYLSADPLSVADLELLFILSFPNLHTIRISNLGGEKNIMCLSYFLNAAKNLKQLHLGPFEDVYVQGLGKWEEDGYDLLPACAKFGSKSEIRLEQLKLLSLCVGFKEMSQAQLFIQGLNISTFSSRQDGFPCIRRNWDGLSEAEMGVGIPISMVIQIQVEDGNHMKCNDLILKSFYTTPSLVALSGMGFDCPEPKMPSSYSFQGLKKLELECTIVWLMDNVKNFPSLKHLVWRPLWCAANQNRQNSVDFYEAYEDFRTFKGCSEPVLEIGDEICLGLQNVKMLRLEKSESVRQNLEIFRIVQDWTTCKILPMDTVYLHLKSLSSNFPRLKTFSYDVHESVQVENLLQIFPQVKEFYFNKFIPITEMETEMAPNNMNSRTGTQQAEVSYKLESFRETMTSFKTEVENQQKLCAKDVEGQEPLVKIGAFIFDEFTRLFRNGQRHQNFELNLPEITSTVSNLGLSAVVIPVQSHDEAVVILEAIKSTEPKNLEHVHFQIMKNVQDPNSYHGISRNVVESCKPFFSVTNDFEPGKNNLNCSVLVKDFWE